MVLFNTLHEQLPSTWVKRTNSPTSFGRHDLLNGSGIQRPGSRGVISVESSCTVRMKGLDRNKVPLYVCVSEREMDRHSVPCAKSFQNTSAELAVKSVLRHTGHGENNNIGYSKNTPSSKITSSSRLPFTVMERHEDVKGRVKLRGNKEDGQWLWSVVIPHWSSKSIKGRVDCFCTHFFLKILFPKIQFLLNSINKLNILFCMDQLNKDNNILIIILLQY